MKETFMEQVFLLWLRTCHYQCAVLCWVSYMGLEQRDRVDRKCGCHAAAMCIDVTQNKMMVSIKQATGSGGTFFYFGLVLIDFFICFCTTFVCV